MVIPTATAGVCGGATNIGTGTAVLVLSSLTESRQIEMYITMPASMEIRMNECQQDGRATAKNIVYVGGRPVCLYEGYRFNHRYGPTDGEGRSVWKCVKQSRNCCRATIIITNGLAIKRYEHNH
ncbi:hypothetical protein MSG28_008196 [Choristoneura fumiferana]|uniref:Uncharacterized protein n=1 Tax=Choristoneura fumiferana TaxID=7141 RepID=A0ACC0JAG9_CHOFU|nr:hypothetical protein MSG28_008196 [Choristoneura fumiferana]